MATIIGISGKIGSGKNYFAEKLMQALDSMGYTTTEGSFAGGLRNELNRIIQTIKVEALEGGTGGMIVEKLSQLYALNEEEAATMYGCLINDIMHVEGLNANSRTESIRRALQILGTDIRRKQNNNYWVDLFFKTLPEADYVIVTDVRFPNEADAIVNHDGFVLRMDLSQDVIDERIRQRDGLKYSEDATTHPSELALDSYEQFSYMIGEKFDANHIATQIINQQDLPKRIEEHGV